MEQIVDLKFATEAMARLQARGCPPPIDYCNFSLCKEPPQLQVDTALGNTGHRIVIPVDWITSHTPDELDTRIDNALKKFIADLPELREHLKAIRAENAT